MNHSKLSSSHDNAKVSEQSLFKLSKEGDDALVQNDGSSLKQCWTKPVLGE